MKRLFLSICLAFLSVVLFGQTDANFQFLAGADFGPGFDKDFTVSSVKPTLETTSYGEHYLGYGYMQFAFPMDKNASNNTGYIQLIWEQNFWDNPLMLHGEFRTYYWGGDFHNVWFAGLGYTFQVGGAGYVEVEPLCRYQVTIDNALVKNHWAPQLSIVDGFDWGWVNIANFNDFWADNQFRFYSETRIFFKVTDKVQLGAYICLNYNDQWNWTDKHLGCSLLGSVKVLL